MEISVSDFVVNQIKNYLKLTYSPTRLFLYGSRINGNYEADSDYDFVMVLSNFESRNRIVTMDKISFELRQKFNIDVQVWAYSEADFLDWKDEFSSIPETALNTGKEIDLGRA